MSSNQDSSFNNFLMGALIGGIIGLLFAPQEGKITRELLKVKGEEALKEFQDNLEKNALKAKLVSEDAVGKIEKRMGEALNAAEDVKDKVEEKTKKPVARVKRKIAK
jgi:gas vesicle protein